MRRLLPLVLFTLSFAGFASQNAFLPNTFKLEFKQSFVKANTGKEKSFNGSFEYKYSGNLIFKNHEKKTVFVSNPEKSWYYQPPFIAGEKGSVQIDKANKTLGSELFDLLKNGLTDNENYTVKYLENQTIELSFSQKMQKELRVSKVAFTIDFQKVRGFNNLKKNRRAQKPADDKVSAKDVKSLAQIKRMSLFYTGGKVVHLEFLSFEKDINFPANHFVFNIPANTRVQRN